MNKKTTLLIILILSILGFIDSYYLTLEHYSKILVPCSTAGIFSCTNVLRSSYSEVFGIPLALIGIAHYTLFSIVNFLNLKSVNTKTRYASIIFATIGTLASLYFIVLQIAIGSICFYCTLSALFSFILLCLVYKTFKSERIYLTARKVGFIYRNIIRKILFMFDAEAVHESTLKLGKQAGDLSIGKIVFDYLFGFNNKTLGCQVAGIEFASPIGLAAGFDYKASLVNFTPSLGFGFMTVGTITNLAYEGNPAPRLGRLPKSKSLLVNKGFKNEGAKVIVNRLGMGRYEIPIGVSIGRSNNTQLKTQKKSIADIIAAFDQFEKAKVKNEFYELNISCPNLIHQGQVVFDESKQLEELLIAVEKLKLKKPVLIKMPIDKSDKETLSLLKIIALHSPKGVIFGNLQKDKMHPSLHSDEVAKFTKGYYSGKPTYDRSNELIKLAYQNYKNRFIIVGCGGVFSADDAYVKIKLGASLVQLITGLVYQGPQLVSEINYQLSDLLKKDGYTTISQAVGVDIK